MRRAGGKRRPAPTSSSSPGRRSSGTSWSRERRLRTTRAWRPTGRSGGARVRPCLWTRPRCIFCGSRTVDVRCVRVSYSMPIIHPNPNVWEQWVRTTRKAVIRNCLMTRRVDVTRTTNYSVSRTRSAYDGSKPPKALRPHFCPSVSPLDLLEPCGVNAARTVLREPRLSNASGLPDWSSARPASPRWRRWSSGRRGCWPRSRCPAVTR